MVVTVIQMHDRDGVISLEVRHTVSEEILLLRYGTNILGLSHSEARELQLSLGAILDSLGEHGEPLKPAQLKPNIRQAD